MSGILGVIKRRESWERVAARSQRLYLFHKQFLMYEFKALCTRLINEFITLK